MEGKLIFDKIQYNTVSELLQDAPLLQNSVLYFLIQWFYSTLL